MAHLLPDDGRVDLGFRAIYETFAEAQKSDVGGAQLAFITAASKSWISGVENTTAKADGLMRTPPQF